MSSDNYLMIVGGKVYNCSASAPADANQLVNPIYEAGSREAALAWIAEHDGFGDVAYSEYGVAYTIDEVRGLLNLSA